MYNLALVASCCTAPLLRVFCDVICAIGLKPLILWAKLIFYSLSCSSMCLFTTTTKIANAVFNLLSPVSSAHYLLSFYSAEIQLHPSSLNMKYLFTAPGLHQPVSCFLLLSSYNLISYLVWFPARPRMFLMVFEYNTLFKYSCSYVKNSLEVSVLWRQKWLVLISNPHLFQSWWAETPSSFPVGMANPSPWASLWLDKGPPFGDEPLDGVLLSWRCLTGSLGPLHALSQVLFQLSAVAAWLHDFPLALLHICSLKPDGKSHLLHTHFSPAFMPVPKQCLKTSDNEKTILNNSPLLSWKHLRTFISLTFLTLHRQPWMMQCLA